MKLDLFTRAYIECALWSSMDENKGEPLDKNYGVGNIAPDTLEQMLEDCERFQGFTWRFIKDNIERAGHDFWLTRNCHGAGFWDGDWPKEIGEHLTEVSKRFGEFNLYIGDDRLIHH